MTPRILIVDDEPRMAAVIARALQRADYSCLTCDSGHAALTILDTEKVDVVVSDWKMPGMDGLELLQALQAQHRDLPVILVTAYGDIPSAVAAMRAGAFDYLTKPFDNDELRALVARALQVHRLERENRYLRQEVASKYTPDAFVAESAVSQELLALVRRVAASRATVLVQGESGTGKELVARLLHYWSDRVGQPFIAVNCKAFAEGVLESELFGHEKGAFTGAVQDRAGCFERAHGGTLFLDEIGEIDAAFQAKLLRVLQEGEVLRVGAAAPRSIDVRVIAATNKGLRDEVTAGRFREDLFFRLNVIPVTLPPLRQRQEDILPLAQHFLRRYTQASRRALTLSPDTEQALCAHPWLGNIRELENAIERAVVLARTAVITPEDLLLAHSPLPTDPSDPSDGGTLQEALDHTTATRVRTALAAAHGQRADAARALGIDRTTLYRMMKRFQIE